MKHILNYYFDHIYCVTVYNFYDRHELAKKQLCGIEFEWILSPPANTLIPTEKLTQSELSVMLGHLSCIWNARLHGYKKVVIWEDDGIFTASEDEMEQFLNAVPQGWDCLYMGDASWDNSIWKMTINPVSEYVNKILWGNGCCFNAIQSHVYDELINQAITFSGPIDYKYNTIFSRGNSYCPSKKYFSDPISMPPEKIAHLVINKERLIPSHISHTL